MMPLCRAVTAAAALVVASFASAHAQVIAPNGQTTCKDKIIALRQDVDKHFAVAKSAIDRKASAAELCKKLTSFSNAEQNMIQYVEKQGIWCGVPQQAIDAMKEGHTRSDSYKQQACNMAAQQQQQRQQQQRQQVRRPQGPSLSDALSAPIPDAETTRTGRGTLDSLGGNPLAR